MKSTVETLEPTKVRLTVEGPYEELKSEMDKAYKEIAGQVGYLTERQLFRLFKKTLSMTPLQIRDQAHSGG